MEISKNNISIRFPTKQFEDLMFNLKSLNASPSLRMASADHLVRAGYFEAVRPFILLLMEILEIRQEARRLLAVCDQLKRWGVQSDITQLDIPEAIIHADIFNKGVMIARRPNSKKLIIVFTGAAKQVWISIHVLHQLLPKDCHILYLMDHKNCQYLLGIEEFGWGYKKMMQGLQNTIKELGCPSCYCIGSSAGGYASLRVGLEIGAQSVLAIAPATDLSTLDSNEFAVQIGKSEQDVISALPDGSGDLLDIFTTKPSTPKVLITYGGANPLDSARALHMRSAPGVKLHEVADFSRHDVLAELIANGDFRILINDMLSHEPA